MAENNDEVINPGTGSNNKVIQLGPSIEITIIDLNDIGFKFDNIKKLIIEERYKGNIFKVEAYTDGFNLEKIEKILKLYDDTQMKNNNSFDRWLSMYFIQRNPDLTDKAKAQKIVEQNDLSKYANALRKLLDFERLERLRGLNFDSPIYIGGIKAEYGSYSVKMSQDGLIWMGYIEEALKNPNKENVAKAKEIMSSVTPNVCALLYAFLADQLSTSYHSGNRYGSSQLDKNTGDDSR